MAYLLAKDTLNGAEGSVVVTRNGQNFVAAGMRNLTPNAEIQSEDMRVIGTRVIQDKPNGVKQTGTGNVYYGSDMWREMVAEYIQTGVMPEFDLQITNNSGYAGACALWLPLDRHHSPRYSQQRGNHAQL